jgi:ParB-like chromosome segregation protein Spo0J
MASPRKLQPLDRIEWVPAAAIVANDYNPNVQPPPENRLLRISLLEDGWTQPVVVFDDGSDAKPVIVDGEHRWRVAATDPEVARLTEGLVPIVRILGDRAHRMMSTVRHNRARGEHAIAPMAEVVRQLLTAGNAVEDVCFLMQMEPEEVDRLADKAGMPTRVSRDGTDFSKGWIPG